MLSSQCGYPTCLAQHYPPGHHTGCVCPGNYYIGIILCLSYLCYLHIIYSPYCMSFFDPAATTICFQTLSLNYFKFYKDTWLLIHTDDDGSHPHPHPHTHTCILSYACFRLRLLLVNQSNTKSIPISLRIMTTLKYIYTSLVNPIL